jgi:hypothetical protein
MASLVQPKFNVHSLFFFFPTKLIGGVECDDIMIEVPNTLVEVDCEEQAQINANGIQRSHNLQLKFLNLIFIRIVKLLMRMSPTHLVWCFLSQKMDYKSVRP